MRAKLNRYLCIRGLSFYVREMKGKKTGGRVKGIPNKTTKTQREILSEITRDYYNSKRFKDDLADIEPRDRLLIMEKLTGYVVPKMQSTTIDATVETRKTIEDKLLELSGNDGET